nr:P9 protein [Tomato chlorosis virus]
MFGIMDLEEMIKELGLAKVERFLTVYNQGRYVAFGNIETLLCLINQHFVEFNPQRAKLDIELSEVRDFLRCFESFRNFGLKK